MVLLCYLFYKYYYILYAAGSWEASSSSSYIIVRPLSRITTMGKQTSGVTNRMKWVYV